MHTLTHRIGPALFVLLLVASAPLLHAEPKATGKQNASELLLSARKALAYTVKSARAAGDDLAPSNPKAKPFLASLKKIDTSLEQAEKSLTAKSPAFFTQIAAADAAVAEMQATWPLTGSSNAEVIRGGRALGGAVTALNENYGPLAARAKAGGPLTAAEKARLAKIKQDQAKLAKQLERIIASPESNKALSTGAKRILKQSKAISNAPDNGAAYAAAMGLLPAIAGWTAGYYFYVPESLRVEWSSFSSYSESWESYYSEEFTEESVEWSSLEESVEIYDETEIAISEEEIEAEESYMEESEMTESSGEELDQLAGEAEEMTAEEAGDAEMESAQEEVAEEADEAAMEEGAEESAAEADGAEAEGDGGMDQGGAEEESAGESADDGGGEEAMDDGGADDGGGDDGGGGEE